MLQRYDHISVREEFAKKQIDMIVEKPSKVVLDPTLLCDRNFWISHFKTKRDWSKRYILAYLVAIPFSYYSETIRKYAEKMGAPVYLLCPDHFPRKGANKNLVGMTPGDLLHAIDNAALIMTNSYHGVAFAINFNKKLIALENPRSPERVNHLLSSIGFKNRIIKCDEPIKTELLNELDFSEANERLCALRIDSLTWLKNALEN